MVHFDKKNDISRVCWLDGKGNSTAVWKTKYTKVHYIPNKLWEYQEYEYSGGICDNFAQIWQMNPLWTRGLIT